MILEEIKIEEARKVLLSTLQRIPEIMDLRIVSESWNENYRSGPHCLVPKTE